MVVIIFTNDLSNEHQSTVMNKNTGFDILADLYQTECYWYI